MNTKQDVIRRVQALMAQAGHPNTGAAEAEAFETKADELIVKWTLSSSDLATAEGRAERPEVRTVDYSGHMHRPWSEVYPQVYRAMAELRGVTMVSWGWERSKVCGWPGDLDMLEMQAQAVLATFVAHIDPVADPTLSEDENIVRVRMAGKTYHQVVRAVWPELVYVQDWADRRAPERDDLDNASRTAYMRCENVWRQHCDITGERAMPRRASWFKSYTLGFSARLDARVRRLRSARSARQDSEGRSVALALRDRDEELQGWMGEQGIRAQTIGSKYRGGEAAGRDAGAAAADRVDLGNSVRGSARAGLGRG